MERALPPAAVDFWQNADPHTVLEGVIPTGAGSQAKGGISRAAHMHLTEPSSHLSARLTPLMCPLHSSYSRSTKERRHGSGPAPRPGKFGSLRSISESEYSSLPTLFRVTRFWFKMSPLLMDLNSPCAGDEAMLVGYHHPRRGATELMSLWSDWISCPIVERTCRRFSKALGTPSHFVKMLLLVEDKPFHSTQVSTQFQFLEL